MGLREGINLEDLARAVTDDGGADGAVFERPDLAQVLSWFNDGVSAGGGGGGLGVGWALVKTKEQESTGRLRVCRIKNKFSLAQEDVVRPESVESAVTSSHQACRKPSCLLVRAGMCCSFVHVSIILHHAIEHANDAMVIS